ncbi:hypothetical protein [Phenylobacterium deserti]|uniref:Uncharacterized protein n=1 Tax=Phenylobacterium deserti TaxID=1914756 RepID=A0A328AT09_9CAUL|nr:hypothetical protein [Phenylobacterium deserti]RAK57689.1 hypothetical protein DJ018_07135 [Phenylobacterium deserti]
MTGALELFRPFAWLALIAFLVGFVSYLALGQPSYAAAEEELIPAYASDSGPVSDDWNIERHI